MEAKISVIRIIQDPNNRYESFIISDCGHWFIMKTGDAPPVGSALDRSQCGACTAMQMHLDRMKSAQDGADLMRYQLAEARDLAHAWRVAAEEAGTYSDELFPWTLPS